MESKLKIKFGSWEHGWLCLSIIINGTTITNEISDVPVDPVWELIKAVDDSCAGDIESNAWLHLEPDYYKLSFKPDKEDITFSISLVQKNLSIIYPGHQENKQTILASFKCKKSKLLTSFWRGLKELSSREPKYKPEVLMLESKLNNI